MAEEKIFTIPLRRKFIIHPKYRRLKAAVRATRDFLVKNLKTDKIKLGKYLNLKLHEHGRKNPPHEIKVKVWKDADFYKAELIDAPIEVTKEEKKLEEKIKEPVKEVKPEVKPEVTEIRESKITEKKEEIEEEKEEVLKHPRTKKVKKEKLEPKRKVKGAKKAGERERKKEIFSKTQKPTHEKKKS